MRAAIPSETWMARPSVTPRLVLMFPVVCRVVVLRFPVVRRVVVLRFSVVARMVVLRFPVVARVVVSLSVWFRPGNLWFLWACSSFLSFVGLFLNC